METIHTHGMTILGIYCHVKYTANNDGITIKYVTIVNNNEPMDVWDNEQLVTEIVNSIYQSHEKANEVDM